MASRAGRLISWVLLVFLFSGMGFGAQQVQAQHVEVAGEEEEGEEKRKRSIHRHNIEVFIGDTYFPHEREGAFTIGLDYEHRFPFWHNQVGVGLLADYEFGTETVGGAFLIGPSFIFFPFGGNFKVFASPGLAIGGREVETQTTALFRGGIGYEFDIHHVFLVAPTLNVDVTRAHTAIVGGVALGVGL